jgi:hypothetical protein
MRILKDKLGGEGDMESGVKMLPLKGVARADIFFLHLYVDTEGAIKSPLQEADYID